MLSPLLPQVDITAYKHDLVYIIQFDYPIRFFCLKQKFLHTSLLLSLAHMISFCFPFCCTYAPSALSYLSQYHFKIHIFEHRPFCIPHLGVADSYKAHYLFCNYIPEVPICWEVKKSKIWLDCWHIKASTYHALALPFFSIYLFLFQSSSQEGFYYGP